MGIWEIFVLLALGGLVGLVVSTVREGRRPATPPTPLDERDAVSARVDQLETDVDELGRAVRALREEVELTNRLLEERGLTTDPPPAVDDR